MATSCGDPPAEPGSKVKTAAPHINAWTIKCTGRSGVCHKSRPSHCPNRNAVYTAARKPTNTVGHNNHEAIEKSPSTNASQKTPASPLYPIRMNAPRASHDLLCGVKTTRRNRALCSRSQTSNTVVRAVNKSAIAEDRKSVV